MLIKLVCLMVISSFVLRVFLSSAIAFESGDVSPRVHFTRSMAQLDRVSALCQDIASANYETYSTHIRAYVKQLYDGQTPYWVLSNVKSRFIDTEYCKWLVVESLIHYQMAYRDYAAINTSAIKPPMLTYDMSQYGSSNSNTRTLGVTRRRINY